MNIRKTVIRLLLIVPALIAVLVVFGGKGAVPHASTAEATGTLTVGLDMKTLQTDPGVYTTLPRFESCVDVNTNVNNGMFYIDVFALNVSQLMAFSADVSFTPGKMQIQQIDVAKLLGTAVTGASTPALPYSGGTKFEAVGVDNGGAGHSGSGVLVRLQAQALVPPSGGVVIPFTISTAASDGVTLTDTAGAHPGGIPPYNIFGGPFINATSGQIAVNRPDADSDGVSDTCDNCPANANGAAQANTPHVGNQLDTDGDGIGDACDPDIDGDGILNGADNCPYASNANQDPSVCADSDGDGVINSLDNCPQNANSNQANNDGDAQGDVCDTDDDNDGVLDTTDNCHFAANANQADWNNNGVGDACQDSDGDNVLDSVDNCKAVPNSNQTETDGDGIGDICDNCPSNSNANQLDEDHDFIGNVCDSDQDGDGIPNVSDPDIDGDGSLNTREAYVGTDPNRRCAATTTANDEAVDSTPFDNGDDRRVNGNDFIVYAPVYGHVGLTPAQRRYDVSGDNRINGNDFLLFAPFYGKTCLP